jgi:hypothetical protein
VTRLYIAGPMTGCPRWNFDAFDEAAAALRAAGYDVVSPHEHDLEMGFDPDAPVAEYTLTQRYAAMRWDLAAVLDVDGVATLRGWAYSTGADLEVRVARGVGLFAQPVDYWLTLAGAERITE